MIPAPSPVLFSQPHAPRCSIFSRMVNASEMIWWDLLLLILATKPIPQASRSKAGSYRPVLAITEISLKARGPGLMLIASGLYENKEKIYTNRAAMAGVRISWKTWRRFLD